MKKGENMAKECKVMGRSADKNKKYFTCGHDVKNKKRKIEAHFNHLAKAKARNERNATAKAERKAAIKATTKVKVEDTPVNV